jgi:hypothetical protein
MSGRPLHFNGIIPKGLTRGLPPMSEAVKRLNPQLLNPPSPAVQVARPVADGFPGGPESELQQTIERYLEAQGFIRLTSGNAERHAGVEIPGWFGHLAQAPGNPFLPDVWVFAHQRPPLLVELKTRNKFGRGQKEMIAAGWWHLVRTPQEFTALFLAWRADV